MGEKRKGTRRRSCQMPKARRYPPTAPWTTATVGRGHAQRMVAAARLRRAPPTLGATAEHVSNPVGMSVS